MKDEYPMIKQANKLVKEWGICVLFFHEQEFDRRSTPGMK